MFSEIDRSLVTWTFNSLPINVSDSSKHFVLEGGDLLVTSTELADSGKYVCVIGDIEINRTVTIQGILDKYILQVFCIVRESLCKSNDAV